MDLFLKLLFPLLICGCVTGQSEWGAWNNQGPTDTNPTYYMDNPSQCHFGGVFDVGDKTATIYGRQVVTSSPSTVLECTITLQTTKIRERREFLVRIESGSVQSDGVSFTMYNGQDKNSNPVFTLRKGHPVNIQEYYKTSGGFVTFYMKKSSANSMDFNIKVIATVMPAEPPSSNDCQTGNEYGCIYYGYKTPVDKETIIGIVGGIFGLILFIVVPIIVICCYRKSRGVNKKWDEFKLSDKANTAADIHSSSASLSRSKRDPWTSNSSRAPYSSYKKSLGSRSRYSDGDESVFSDGTDIPPKHRPPPPPYEEYDRGRSYRDGLRSYRNGRDDRYNRNDRYDDRDYRSDRNHRTRYDSEKREPSQKSFGSSDDASFVQGRDDHPQEVFVERIIEPRVKPRTKADLQKYAKYDDDDDPYDKIVEKDSPKPKPKKELKESAMQCDEESSDDNESNTETDDANSSTEETDEDDIIKKKEMEAKKSALYAKPNKTGKKQNLSQPQSSQPVVGAYPGGNVVPGHPVVLTRPPFGGPQVIARPVYPQQPYFNQPTHTRPVVSLSALPPQPPVVQGYQHPAISGRLPNSVQAPRPPHPPMYSASQPPQQPIFTHLVQRGYDGHTSSLDGSEGRNQTDDSDMTANLGSGVEFMKRTTTTV